MTDVRWSYVGVLALAALVVVALVAVGWIPVVIGIGLGVLAAIGGTIGLVSAKLLPERASDGVFGEAADPRIEILVGVLFATSVASFVAGAAGVTLGGVNVLVASFPALAAIAFLYAADAAVYGGDRTGAAGAALMGIGWLLWGATAIGVPAIVGSVVALLGALLALGSALGGGDDERGDDADVPH